MFKTAISSLAVAGALVVFATSAGAQTRPVSGLYQIVDGTYSACCGFGGPIESPLPSDSQSFVSLTIDPQTGLAAMTFLGRDTHTIFSILACPSGDPIEFSFNFGLVGPDGIFFHVDPGPPPNSEFWSLTVSNAGDALRIDGVVGIDALFCADLPTRFSYSNVRAMLLLPRTIIRCSEVEICWPAASNRTYQVQYQSALTTNTWIDLGSPVTGNGATNSTICLADKVALGQPQRFYRVLTKP